MDVRTACPQPSFWKGLLDGTLPPTEEKFLHAHLECCVRCQETLQGLAAGSESWKGLPRIFAEREPAEEPALREVMAEMAGRRESAETQAELPNFLTPSPDPRHLGRLGPYEVVALIGRGGIGMVFRAFDPKLERPVAIKVMAPELAAQPSARERFLREARTAAQVCHEHVVAIHAVDESRGLPYLVMQYVAGGSLEERLTREGPLPLPELLRVGIQVASGLAAAHARGLVHRDIKPANVLLDGGRAKITDFGLARAVDDLSLTQSGQVTGTPEYMAPEQARGEFVDHRADLFSLGSLLYVLGTGRSPFRGGSPLAVLRRVCDDTPPPLNDVNPALPRWLAGIIGRLQAKDPAQRFQSAAEVGNLLERHLKQLQRTVPAIPLDGGARSGDHPPARHRAPSSLGTRTLAETIVEELPAPPERRPWKWIALAATLLVGLPVLGLLALGFYALRGGSHDDGERQAITDPSGSGVPATPLVAKTKGADKSDKADLPPPVPEKRTSNPPPPQPSPVVEEPRPPLAPTVPEPKLSRRKVEVNLSEPFAQVHTGGGGRFLIFHLKKAKKLAIFDVTGAKIVRELDAPDDVRYAAGLDRLLMVLPGQRLIQRWNLRTFEREKTAPAPDGVVTWAFMGCNSPGPLLLQIDGKIVGWDVERMEPMYLDGTGLNGNSGSISADGQAIVVWHSGISGQQYTLVRFRKTGNGLARSPDAHSFNGHWAMPNADASMIFRYGAGIYDGQMKILPADAFQGAILLPTQDARFFLAVRGETRDTEQVTICTSTDLTPVFTVHGVEPMKGSILNSAWGHISGEPRVRYLPSANVLVNLPDSNDRVVIRRLDLIEELNRSGQDYLFVVSRPPNPVAAGSVFDYRMDIRSKANVVRCTLESGPKGMTVSDSGEVRWSVPARLDQTSARVIITVRSAGGKEAQHSFDLALLE